MSRRNGLPSLGVALGAAAAGAVLGVAAERLAVGRPLLPQRPEPRPRVALGSIRGQRRVVKADDGTRLHVEVDEPDEPDPDGLTIVFCHGYALNLDSWHYQREALRGTFRLVFWDQRGHGRSERGPKGSATIDQVGCDLESVIRAAAPTGPLVLVGHSMGGMTVMSLAAHSPELFAARVIGVALVATSAGNLADVDLGMKVFGKTFQKLAPKALGLLAGYPSLVERSRSIGSDLEQVLVRRYSYSSEVSDELVDFTARMIASTRIEVINDYFPTFGAHDKAEALATMAGIETLVLVGDSDLLTPVKHSADIVRRLPHAEHVVVADGGHLVMLEHSEVVTPHLVALVDRARRAARTDRTESGQRSGETQTGRTESGRTEVARPQSGRTVGAARRSPRKAS
ncbi:MAG TPA: alpha/beta hydrolase [Actinomycetales bacterium]|nr:alpha/beta hydrolase [Actinomycetales bacterium]